jgi:hypothetical protein
MKTKQQVVHHLSVAYMLKKRGSLLCDTEYICVAYSSLEIQRWWWVYSKECLSCASLCMYGVRANDAGQVAVFR